MYDHWERVVEEFADVFEPPGPPVLADINHHIDLITQGNPPRLRLYRMSKEKLAAVKSTIADYL